MSGLPDPGSDAVRVAVNGEPVSLPPQTSIAAYVQSLGVLRGHVAVERNGNLVPRERFDAVLLNEGDRLEVVTLVGGG